MNESKATRYQRGRRRAVVSAGVVTAGVLAVCVAAGPDAGWAAIAARAGQPWPWAGPAVSLAVYALGLAIAWRVLQGCVVRLLVSRTDRLGRARHAEREPVIGGALREVMMVFALAWLAGIVVWTSGVVAGAWWWALASVVVAGALVGAMHLGPGLIARVSGARPIARPALVEALGALARQVRVPIASIDALPASAAVTATALVAGGGEARRVFIAHELLQDWSDDEIAVVVAHELAHHAHHDLWRTLLLDLALVAAGLGASAAALRAAGLAAGGVPVSLVDLSAVALVAGAVWVAFRPLRYGLFRRQERAADLFALGLTGKTGPFQAAIRRLAARHLAEERPSRFARWFFHRHPTPAERLDLAEGLAGRRAHEGRLSLDA